MATTEATNNRPKEQAFFVEEASKQILVRISNVLQDLEICDAVFIVDHGIEREEIRAPSQIMKEDVKTDEKKEGDEEKKEAVSDDKAEVVELDARNLIHFLKNTIKYDTPDLRDIVIARYNR